MDLTNDYTTVRMASLPHLGEGQAYEVSFSPDPKNKGWSKQLTELQTQLEFDPTTGYQGGRFRGKDSTQTLIFTKPEGVTKATQLAQAAGFRVKGVKAIDWQEEPDED